MHVPMMPLARVWLCLVHTVTTIAIRFLAGWLGWKAKKNPFPDWEQLPADLQRHILSQPVLGPDALGRAVCASRALRGMIQGEEGLWKQHVEAALSTPQVLSAATRSAKWWNPKSNIISGSVFSGSVWRWRFLKLQTGGKFTAQASLGVWEGKGKGHTMATAAAVQDGVSGLQRWAGTERVPCV